MKSLSDGYGYNERLFSGGLRTTLHTARFHWLVRETARHRCHGDAVLELGCFDGKLLDFLPWRPARYLGVDANWEGGLDLARARWGGLQPAIEFRRATSAREMGLRDDDRFDLAVAMETLEHIPPHEVGPYLDAIAHHLDGYLLVTVPNEKGLVFLAKWLVKRLLRRDAEHYRPVEVLNALVGRLDRVERNEHKGFDYRALVDAIAERFDIVSVTGHPGGFLPPALCFGIGIVARSRRDARPRTAEATIGEAIA